MKHILKLVPVLLSIFLMASCANDALDDLDKNADEQAKRIAQVDKDAKSINTQMSNIKVILDKFATEDRPSSLMISAINPITEGGKEVGYKIEFTDGSTPIEIRDGVTPVVTIDEITKNWVINGVNTTILATGKDVVEGDLALYQVKKEGDFWAIYNGTTWTTTTVRANGEKGDAANPAPVVTVANNVWVIDGVPTTSKVQGQDAVAPKVEAKIVAGVDMWHFSNDNGATWTNTGVPTKGDKGAQGTQGDKGTDAAVIESIIYDGDNVSFTFGKGLKDAGLPDKVSILRTPAFVFNLKNGLTPPAPDFATVFKIDLTRSTILEYVLDTKYGTPHLAFVPKGMIVAIAPNTTGQGKISISRHAEAVAGTILLEVTDEKDQTIVRRIKVEPSDEVIKNIGDLHEGGIIFFVGQTGNPKYRIIALTETELEWTSRIKGSAIVGANDVTYGNANMSSLKNYLASTIEIVTMTEFPAFKYCDELKVENKGSWYLPAKDELTQLFDPIVVNLVNVGLTDKLDPTATYWSSTQINTLSVWGYEQGAATPLEMGTGVKNKVRAIKLINE